MIQLELKTAASEFGLNLPLSNFNHLYTQRMGVISLAYSLYLQHQNKNSQTDLPDGLKYLASFIEQGFSVKQAWSLTDVQHRQLIQNELQLSEKEVSQWMQLDWDGHNLGRQLWEMANHVLAADRADLGVLLLQFLQQHPLAHIVERERAQALLKNMQGEGSFGGLLFYQLKILPNKVFSTSGIVAMASAFVTYRYVQRVLGEMLAAQAPKIVPLWGYEVAVNRGVLAAAYANTTAFVAENAVFTGMGASSSYYQNGPLSEKQFAHLAAGNAITLGLLKVSGFIANSLTSWIHGNNILGQANRFLEYQSITRPISQNILSVSALTAAPYLEYQTNLRETLPHANLAFADAVSTQVSAGLGMKLAGLVIHANTNLNGKSLQRKINFDDRISELFQKIFGNNWELGLRWALVDGIKTKDAKEIHHSQMTITEVTDLVKQFGGKAISDWNYVEVVERLIELNCHPAEIAKVMHSFYFPLSALLSLLKTLPIPEQTQKEMVLALADSAGPGQTNTYQLFYDIIDKLKDSHFLIQDFYRYLSRELLVKRSREIGEWVPRFRNAVLTYLSSQLTYQGATELVFKLPSTRNMDAVIRIAETLDRDIHFNIPECSAASLRAIIHSQPSADNIPLVEKFIMHAEATQTTNPIAAQALPLLKTLRRFLVEMYSGKVKLDDLTVESRVRLRDRYQINPEDLQEFSKLNDLLVNIGNHGLKTWSVQDLATKTDLLQFLPVVEEAVFAKASPQANEIATSQQVAKLAMLARCFYAMGMDGPGIVELARRLDDLANHWDTMDSDIRMKTLQKYGMILKGLQADIQNHYHENLDPLASELGVEFGKDEEWVGNFAANHYRRRFIILLDAHLKQLKVLDADPVLARKQIDLLTIPMKEDFHFVPLGTGDHSIDLRNYGAKAKGLDELMRLGFRVPAAVVLVSRAMELGVELGIPEQIVVEAAKQYLETMTGKTLGDGLELSARSGAAFSMPGLMETELEIKNFETLLAASNRVYQSWFGESAQELRDTRGILDDWGTGVTFQQMVYGTRDRFSGAGIAESRGNGRGNPGMKLRFAHQGTGQELASGAKPGYNRLPAELSHLEPELLDGIKKLEDHFGYPVEVEFTIDSGVLWWLQVREAKLSGQKKAAWAIHKWEDQEWNPQRVYDYLGGKTEIQKLLFVETVEIKEGERPPTMEGTYADGAAVVGKVAFNVEQIKSIQSDGAIAVYIATNPDSYESGKDAIIAGASIVLGGGSLSHLSAVLRSLNKPHVGGFGSYNIYFEEGLVTKAVIQGKKLRFGDVVTLDTEKHLVYQGWQKIIRQPSVYTEQLNALLQSP